jgi:hypothetical protein
LIGRIRELKVSQFADKVRSHESSVVGVGFLTHIADKAAHAEATEALARAKDERDRDEVLLGRAVDADVKESGALGNLARYEAHLERSLFRTCSSNCSRMCSFRNRARDCLGAVRLISANEPSRYFHISHTYFRQIP